MVTATILLIILYSNHGLAQPSVRLKHYSTGDGLSQGTVYSMLQDSRGFMWIGTWDGLNRFDGYDFKTYKPHISDTGSIAGNYVNSIVEDKTGNIWVGTNEALNRFDPLKQQFTSFYLPGNSEEKKAEYKIIYIDDQEQLWITFRKQLIYVFDTKDKRFASLDYTEGFVGYNEITNNNKEYFRPVSSLYTIGKNGIIQFDTKSGTVLHKSPVPYVTVNIQEDELRTAYIDTGNIVWVASRGGLLKQNMASGQWKLFNKKAGIGETNGLVAITPYDSNSFWLGSFGFGAHLFNKNQEAFTRHLQKDAEATDGLSENIIEEIYRDKDGNHWFGVQPSGLNMFNPALQQFQTITINASAQVGAKNNSAQGITSAGTNTILMGFFQSGLLKYNLQTGAQKIVRLAGNEKEITAQSCFTDDHKTVWAGSDYGLFFSTDNAETFKPFLALKHYEFYDMFVFCPILSGGFFYGNSEGLYTISYPGKMPVRSAMPVIRDTIIHIASLTPNKFVYVNARNELVVFNWQANKITILNKIQLPVFARHIAIENENTIWLSTSSGIIIKKLDSGKQEILNESNGLSNNYVYAILSGDDGNMWASTNDGINKITITNHSIHHFNLSAGLQGKEFNTGSYYKNEDGLLFFGGTNGANYFDPKSISIPGFNVQLHLMVAAVNDQEKEPETFLNSRPFELGFKENNVSFSFTAIDFNRSANIIYSYKINNRQWINIGNERTLRLLNLAPGNYVLQVKAGLKSGMESNRQLTLRFDILPPWYRTNIAYLFFVLIALAVIYGIVKFIIGNKIKQQKILYEKQQAVIHERERIISDLHDDVGGGLSTIRMMSDLMITQYKKQTGAAEFEEDVKQGFAQKISATAKDIAQRMHTIIWSLNADNDTLGNFSEYVRQFGVSFFEDTGILFAFEATNIPEAYQLNGIQRKNLFMITKESFHNVLKHSNATKVEVKMYMQQQALHLEIRDNGCGFKMVNQFGNGLKNMHKRMEEINGEINLQNSGGTSIQLTLPF
ncbi:MAG: two-component regulator propeller domain-containing protein [Bacteroidota bacterium]